MTATNIFSYFGGFRCSYPSLWYIPPLIYGRLRIYSWLMLVPFQTSEGFPLTCLSWDGGGGGRICDMRQLFSGLRGIPGM